MTSTVLSAGDAIVKKTENALGAHVLGVGRQIMPRACIFCCCKENNTG